MFIADHSGWREPMPSFVLRTFLLSCSIFVLYTHWPTYQIFPFTCPPASSIRAAVVVNFASVVRKSLAYRQRISCFGGSVSAESLRKVTERSLSLDSEAERTHHRGPVCTDAAFQQRQLYYFTIMKCYLQESKTLWRQPNVWICWRIYFLPTWKNEPFKRSLVHWTYF